MSNTIVDADDFWGTDLNVLEEQMGVNLQELMLKANSTQSGGIQAAEKTAEILGR